MNKQKGFTLIELLVVVAIIGILAAVGVVAYSGYTSGAKKNATLTIHQTVVRYLSNELMKCQIESSGTILDGYFNCSDDLDLALWLIQSQLCLQVKFGAKELPILILDIQMVTQQ